MSSSTPRIRDYMTRSPHSVSAEQTVDFAQALMRGHRVRHLPVLRGGRLVGMLSERDIYWSEALRERGGPELLVEEAMSPAPFAVAPDAPLSEVVREMAERKYGSAVVMEGEQVVGLFTTTDALAVLAAMLAGQEVEGGAARPS